MSTRIGCDNLVYAMLTADAGSADPTYSAPKAAPGVTAVNINPNPSQETLFADDGPYDTATTLGRIEVSITKAELTTENKSDLLGHAIDIHGGLVYGDSDVPPWVAIAFRTLKSNGTYKYVWLYKGKFMEPEINNETKGDSVNFQTDTITGQFARLNRKFTIGSKVVRPWKYDMDEEDADVEETIIDEWFDAVVLPNKTITP